MSNDQLIAEHYTHGDLLNSIRDALERMGSSVDEVTVDELAAVDEFHIGGRPATERLLDRLDLGADQQVLDIGCGLGGAARYVASRYQSRVSGIDLTEEYVATGNVLCSWVGLDDQVSLHHGSALTMPFADQAFDAAYMQHVAMNIADKRGLFVEAARVLRPGAVLAVHDVMRCGDAELAYPVPWAADPDTSHLSTPEQYRQALTDAGFAVSAEYNQRNFALQFFARLRARSEAAGGPPPLGLHTLMQQSTRAKIDNMIDNIERGCIAPVEMLAHKL